jgi:renal tumor antigen
MKSLDHMHKKGIFHRDIKPENILIESGTEVGKGLKLADFGSCRGIYSKQPYTEYISTRWYRAPECLLTDGYYGPEMDLWGAGCVMFEITSLYPLFPGSNESDQINRIHKILGTPSNEMLAKFKSKGASHISFDFPEQKAVGIGQLIPHASPEAIDLITKLLKYDSSERITAREAMRHPYLKEMREMDSKRSESSPSNAKAATIASDLNGSNGAKKIDQAQGSNSKSLPTIDTSTKATALHSKSAAPSQGFSPNSSNQTNHIAASIGATLPPINGPVLPSNNKPLLSGRTGQATNALTASNLNLNSASITSNNHANATSQTNNKKKKKARNLNAATATAGANASASIGNPTQNADQVMKTYGLRNHPPVVEAVLKQYNAPADGKSSVPNSVS